MKQSTDSFDINCDACSRLSTFLTEVKAKHTHYYCKPVPSFGVAKPKLLIVGLAPGMHGANATGRPFTGDHAGILLYETLFKYGFSNKPESIHAKDKLKLKDCKISNAVKCLPPDNKPTMSEIKNCNHFLKNELHSYSHKLIIIALGKIAHDAVIRATENKLSEFKFAHASEHALNAQVNMIDSYHCSRYNTNTRRLTETMFHDIFARARMLVDALYTQIT